MGLLSRLKKAAGLECVRKPCVQTKDSPNSSDNRQPNPPDAAETDGGRNEKKKKSFWKWPALHVPCRRAGTYDLVKGEKKCGIEAGTYQRNSDAPAPEILPVSEEQQKHDVLDKGQRVQGPCVLPPSRQRIVVLIHLMRRLLELLRLLEGEWRQGERKSSSLLRNGLCRTSCTRVAVKCSRKMPNMPSIKVPGHPKRLPMEIGLMLMANKGPSAPQIIQLLDWEDDTDHCVMVMERPIPCMDLFSFVDHHGGSLDEGMARNIMRQVTDAAKTCCDRGIFHRDLKLENLLMNEDTMEVKLIDFRCGALMKKSAFKIFHGTRVYCPPEFYMKGRYHAKPTTVWTLGFILYEMLCGECPASYDRNMITVNFWTRPGFSKGHGVRHKEPQKTTPVTATLLFSVFSQLCV
ncbi:hypothetical protein cypCar_00041623 [Cyprinus carpio]|nr:hypothetical protein cypCar_00041623 [Cyprinus carpio]